MMIHHLKTVQPFFGDMKTGIKTFESRKDDRNFQVGDILVLHEYDPRVDEYSGDVLYKKVTYKLPEGVCSPGYCVLQTEDFDFVKYTKTFRVLGTKEFIPWFVILKHEDQALKNHGNQSLNRLNQRGGLSWSELLAVLEDRNWIRVDEKLAKEIVMAFVQAEKRKHGLEGSLCQN